MNNNQNTNMINPASSNQSLGMNQNSINSNTALNSGGQSNVFQNNPAVNNMASNNMVANNAVYNNGAPNNTIPSNIGSNVIGSNGEVANNIQGNVLPINNSNNMVNNTQGMDSGVSSQDALNQPLLQINSNQLLNNQENNSSSSNAVNNPFLQQDNSRPSTYLDILKKEEINVQDDSTKFITGNNFNETAINDLNVNDDYNQNKIDYRNNPKVMENLENRKKTSVPISKELKTIFIIALVIFVFIIIVPYIFDFVRMIRY